ncbi:hypothetical protein [Endozoicomonas sp.]|uniref:hypothetical protein n=1 Tax=Endozoicomonas sp. TaxID=1892382 RepID=UPI0028855179|nr:hypothetical protein [Endozoicomonas sp.]
MTGKTSISEFPKSPHSEEAVPLISPAKSLLMRKFPEKKGLDEQPGLHSVGITFNPILKTEKVKDTSQREANASPL